MKALYKCAKIAQSLQHNIRPFFTLDLLYFSSKVSVFNLLAVTKTLITNYYFFINSFMAEVPII